MKAFLRLICLALTLAACVCVFSSCDGEAEQEDFYALVAEKVGDYEITARELQFRYSILKNSVAAQYSSTTTLIGLDLDAPLSTQMFDENTTWARYLLDTALAEAREMAYFYNEALSQGYESQYGSESDEYVTDYMINIAGYANTYGMETDAYIKAAYGEGMDSAWLREYLRRSRFASAYYSDETENFKASVGQLDPYYDAYYAENTDYCEENSYNTVVVRHVLVIPKMVSTIYLDDGETPDTEATAAARAEANAAAKETAEGYLNEWLGTGATEELFSQYAVRYSQDTGSASGGGLYKDFQKDRFNAAFDAWSFDEARKPGDYEIIESEIGFHIMYFVGEGRPYWQVLAESSVYSGHYTELVDSLAAKYAVTDDETVLDALEKRN